MTKSPGRFAYRCLPLVIANSHGWELLVDQSFSATWSGCLAASEMKISFLDERRSPLPASHFGMGILTFQAGYLFETEERHNLWVAGPINQPKDGIVPLCGVVEADWGPYTFTMNWMFTRPGTVRFEKGEPFCHVFPIPRQLLAVVQPEIRDMSEIPQKAETLASWRAERDAVLERVRKGEMEPTDQVFGMHYFRGQTPSSESVVADHVTRLTLKPFRDHTARQVSRPKEEEPEKRAFPPRNEAPARAALPPAERLVRAHFMSNGSRSETVAFPDPFFSVSISGEGGLDEAVLRAVAPFWRRLRQGGGEGHSYLWFQRKRDRLAIHLHGPEDEAVELREWLEEAVAGFSPEWHAYRREEEDLLDHHYASLATLCQARGCDFVLASLSGDSTITQGSRRKTILRALLAGLSTLDMPREMRFSYLDYHRDSVLREATSLERESEGLPRAVAALDIKAGRSTTAIERFQGMLVNEWNGHAPQPEPDELGSWQRSLIDVCKQAGSSSHRDRWAPEPAFVPLYKACHGIANQVGMAPLDEAFLCHLLVRARPPET